MANVVCGISNEIPEFPVVSPVSGQIFERRLIEKYVKENGKDPLVDKPLNVEQLIELRVASDVLTSSKNGPSSSSIDSQKDSSGTVSSSLIVKPKAPSSTSIPAIIKTMQDEWDALMLHSFSLRTQLQTARQELSHALYQHDAACRVIARLTRELDAAREALATLRPQKRIPQSNETPLSGSSTVGISGGDANNETPSCIMEQTPQTERSGHDNMESGESASSAGKTLALETPVGMSQEIVDVLQEKGKILTGERKQKGKQVPVDLTPADDIRSFVYSEHQSPTALHSVSNPGILALDIHEVKDRIVTAGADKTVVVYNRNDGQVMSVLKGHVKKVSCVVYHPSTSEEIVFSGSNDSTVRMFSNFSNSSNSVQCKTFASLHQSSITGLDVHATGDFILSTSTDAHWAFTDIRRGALICKVASETGSSSAVPLTCGQFHPDGLILATGTSNSIVKMWDLKEQQNVANFEGHTGPISALAFSENGYYLATAGGPEDGSVKLWDLRKLKNFKTINLNEDFSGKTPSSSYQVKDLCFNKSGTYLGVAGSDVRVYLCKQWTRLSQFQDHSDLATGVRFGLNASYVASCSLDRSLKIYSN